MMMANAALHIDEINRRPIFVLESSPYRILAIDGDRISNPHVPRGPANVFDIFLERELRRVHADHYQSSILVFLGPRANVGQCAQPIDTGVGPKLDQDNVSPQSGDRQWLRIEPAGRAAEGRKFSFNR